MKDHALIGQWWTSIQSLETTALEENASSLCQLHNSERILNLVPLPDLNFPVLRSSDLFTRKLAFKHLGRPEILFLRKCILMNEQPPELTAWAEYLLRFLEVNRTSIIKKVRLQFGSTRSWRIVLLELTAFLLDVYFKWEDLRYLNLALKYMDMPGIFSLHHFSNKIPRRSKKLPLILIQVRLMILRQAAIERLNKS